MEYLDYYDENRNFLGSKTRDEVHQEGLWHKTVHCWLYDLDGNVYFQIRKDSNKFYTTASGHLLKGESVQDAFKREIQEEIGLDIDSSDALLVDIVEWKMDKVKKDGSVFKDSAWAHVYLDLFEGDLSSFSFDEEEVLGVVKVNALDTLHLFETESGEIKGSVIQKEGSQNIEKEMIVSLSDFLVMDHETALGKYGSVLKKVIDVVNSN